MPPQQPVDSLQKICNWNIANHLFNVISSWYKSSDDPEKFTSESENISSFDYSNCYEAKEGPSATRNEWFVKTLMNGTVGNQVHDGRHCECSRSRTGKKEESSGNRSKKSVWEQSEDFFLKKFEGKKINAKDLPRRGLSPVPEKHKTKNSASTRHTSQLRDYVSREIPSKFHQDILATLINLTSQKVEIPKPQEESQEDLDFINSLGFILRVSISCLLTRGVQSLDFSSVAHMVKKWRLQCRKVDSSEVKEGRNVRPYFDIFSYALDVTAPGLQTLKKLKLPHFVTNSFVRKVGFLCPSLNDLILGCTFDCRNLVATNLEISDLDVLYGYSFPIKCPDRKIIQIRGCKNLVTLELPEQLMNTNICCPVANMLQNMPELQRLVGAPMINVVQYINEELHCTLKPTKLTNFHHISCPPDYEDDTESYANLSNLSEMFPLVKEVLILMASDADTDKVLRSFPKADNISVAVNPEVHLEHFTNLVSLEVSYITLDWEFLVNLNDISPNLEHLSIGVSVFGNNAFLTTERDNPGIEFASLHTLSLEELSRLRESTLLPLLGCFPALSNFYLTTEPGCSGIQSTLQQALPSLCNIQKFALTMNGFEFYSKPQHNDTMPNIEYCKAMISACPNLMYIGKVGHWNVSQVEFAALQEEAKARNWNLEIVW